MRVLVTGAAGFIGYHLSRRLLDEGHQVLGYDSLNEYYDPRYKLARLETLKSRPAFLFERGLLEDRQALGKAWKSFDPTHVVNLAAQAGVRYSLENPRAYVSANIDGFLNVVELARERKVENLVYGSSSSVYGANEELPFSEEQKVSRPVSLYGMTKIANELLAHAYNHLFEIPATGLRFFTVYGPFSRPDMAMFSFAQRIARREPIELFNDGNMTRDFTFVEDIVDGVMRAVAKPQANQIYNLGKGKADALMDMVRHLEAGLGVPARIELKPMHRADVRATLADISKARKELGYDPKTPLEIGIRSFVSWFKEYHGY